MRDRKWKWVFVDDVLATGLHLASMKSMVLKSYLLGFLNGIDQRFQDQAQSSEKFGLMVKIPAEVLEEQRLRMGKLESRSLKIEIEVDYEAYIAGFEHAKETRLLSEELLNK